MSGPAQLEAVLNAARVRLALASGGRRAGWLLLAGILGLELGWVLEAPSPLGGSLVLALGLGLLVAALAAMLVEPRPTLVLAAEVLDARLSSGATVASGAEALSGGHGRFASSLIHEAARAIEGVSLSELAPLRAPTGLVLGLGAAVLFPFVFAGGEPLHAAPDPLPSLLDPPRASSGAGGGPIAESEEQPGGDWELTAPLDSGAPEPWDALPLEVAEDLREQLEALLAQLGPSSTGSGEGGSKAGAGGEALDQALVSKDPQRIQRELRRLAERAGAGDSTAAVAMKTLLDGLAPPGAGAAEGSPGEPGEGAAGGDAPPPLARVGRGLPWDLEEACRRYFD